MKNRKVIVTAFLLVAVMLLGVGYAAVSDTLNFGGDATISGDQAQHEFDVDVRITAVSENMADWEPYSDAGAEIERANDFVVDIMGSGDNEQDVVDFQIFCLSNAGQYKEFWFKVENDSTHDATLKGSDITENGTHDYFTADYEIYTADGSTTTEILPAGGEVLVKVVITVKATPTELYQGNFSFVITAEADQK
jgi:hypothetical protein